MQAFAAQTIPIYWGDPQVSDVFNNQAFINVADFGSVQDVVSFVKEIDNDDNLFYSMLETPALVSNEYSLINQTKKLEAFLLNIFEQSISEARRRTRFAYYEIELRRKSLEAFYKSKLPFVKRCLYPFKEKLRLLIK